VTVETDGDGEKLKSGGHGGERLRRGVHWRLVRPDEPPEK
jgi:hypothetical protein